jgi:hypothetical protein
MRAIISLVVAVPALAGAMHAVADTGPATPLPATPAAGVVPPTAAPIAQPLLRERLGRLRARARSQAHRLGLRPPAHRRARGIAGLDAEGARLARVLEFLEGRRELRRPVDRRARPAALPRGRALASRVVAEHRRAVRLAIARGLERPGALRLAGDRMGRIAQLARWRAVADWLARAKERVRPGERPARDRIPYYDALSCVAGHESGSRWDAATGNGYYGGLQMGVRFQQTYGPELYAAKGTADHWTADEQMIVAGRAVAGRGFTPWPMTARACGLL